MRRSLVFLAAAVGLVVAAAPASAHSEFEPSAAAPGSVIELELSIANEQSDAGTTQVELFFPETVPVVLAELPAAEGWQVTTEGGEAGSSVTSVTWSRAEASPDDDPLLPIRLGPLPTETGRLQFKVLQTYGNGEVDRWIADWPEGAPEPDHPGPVLDVVAGAAGEVPEATSATTSAPTPTSAVVEDATTTTTAAPDDAVAADDDDDDGDDSNAALIIVVVVVVAGLAGGIGYLVRRRRSA